MSGGIATFTAIYETRGTWTWSAPFTGSVTVMAAGGPPWYWPAGNAVFGGIGDPYGGSPLPGGSVAVSVPVTAGSAYSVWSQACPVVLTWQASPPATISVNTMGGGLLTWTAPGGVSSVIVSGWGPGGAGASTAPGFLALGYEIPVAGGGTTFFTGDSGTVTALPGASGLGAGTGGAAGAGPLYSGGGGAAGSPATADGGGGGGAAGSSGTGTAGSGATGGAAGSGGGAGGDGGMWSFSIFAGSPGASPGGGGGGAVYDTGDAGGGGGGGGGYGAGTLAVTAGQSYFYGVGQGFYTVLAGLGGVIYRDGFLANNPFVLGGNGADGQLVLDW